MLDVLLFNCEPLISTTIELLISNTDEFRLLSTQPTLCQSEKPQENSPPDTVVMWGGVNTLH